MLLRNPWHQPPCLVHQTIAVTFFIYVAVSQEMIGMVLVQEDEELHEHVIYYLSRNVIDLKLHYSNVEKLALATVHAVHRLRHYILIR